MKRLILLALSAVAISTSCSLFVEDVDVVVGVYGGLLPDDTGAIRTATSLTLGGSDFEPSDYAYSATVTPSGGLFNPGRLKYEYSYSDRSGSSEESEDGELDLDAGKAFVLLGTELHQFWNLFEMNAFMDFKGLPKFIEPSDYGGDDGDLSDPGDAAGLIGTTWRGTYDYYGVSVVEYLKFTTADSGTSRTEAGGDYVTDTFTYTYDSDTQTGTLSIDSTLPFSIEGNVLTFNHTDYYKQ